MTNEHLRPIASDHIIMDWKTSTSNDDTLVHFHGASDPTESQVLRLIEESSTLDFWCDGSEDIYSADDGEPIQ